MWEKDSARHARLPDDWDQLRERRLRMDGYRCRWRLPTGGRCGARATQVDHVTPGDDHSIGNLQSLCETHHAKKSAWEGVQARRRMQAARKRPGEKHPGVR